MKQVAVSRAWLREVLEAFQWCSGSQDFQQEGKARVGWNKIVKPLMGGLADLLEEEK